MQFRGFPVNESNNNSGEISVLGCGGGGDWEELVAEMREVGVYIGRRRGRWRERREKDRGCFIVL